MTISCKSILDEVAKSTAYLGAKRGDYERLSTTDANDEILARYWREAVAEAAVEMGAAAQFTLTESPAESVEVALDSAIDPALAESLLRAFLIDRVTARWLALAGIDSASAGTANHATTDTSATSLSGIASITTLSRPPCALTRPLSPF